MRLTIKIQILICKFSETQKSSKYASPYKTSAMRSMFIVLLLLSSFLGFAQLRNNDVQTFELANGMKFFVIEDHSIPSANMYFFYKVGSRNERQGITGISHFFEHMMFNGSKKYGPKEFDKIMELYGGSNNAYTTKDLTVYTDWFPSSSIEKIFDLESDRISSLTIAPNMVESERGVVLSERSTNLENSPWEWLDMLVNAQAFIEHPYHWPVLGYEDDMKNWKQTDLENYYKTYYAPNNCTVVIAGDVSFDNVKMLAEKYMANIPSQHTPPHVNSIEPQQKGERRVVMHKDVNTPYIQVSYHVPQSMHTDYYALSLLQTILSTGRSSRLQASLVDKKQLATDVGVLSAISIDPYLFSFYLLTAKEISPKSLEQALYDELNMLKNEAISEKELQKAKNQKLMELYAELSTINGKANTIGTYIMFFGDHKKLIDAPNAYQQVTTQDIQRVVNKYFTQDNRTVGIISAN